MPHPDDSAIIDNLLAVAFPPRTAAELVAVSATPAAFDDGEQLVRWAAAVGEATAKFQALQSETHAAFVADLRAFRAGDPAATERIAKWMGVPVEVLR